MVADLNLAILSVRPGRKGKDYDKIWNKARNEGPLKTFTRSQAEKLAVLLADERIVVDWAMRYANPPTAARIEHLQRQGCDRLLVVPLYPQYAAASTATACDEAFRALMRLRWQPSAAGSSPLLRRSRYIDALADSIRGHLATVGFEPEALIASFHGMPQRYLDAGDPTTANARRPRGSCAKSSAGPASAGTPPSNRASATSRGCSPPPSRRSRGWQGRASSAWPSSPRASPSTAWRRWRSSTWRTAPSSSPTAASTSPTCPCLNDGELGMRVIEAVVRRELMGWV
jgi:ferrochelatase